MNVLPPSFARVRVSRNSDTGRSVWLPLFLLWPLWLIALSLFCIGLLALTAITGTHAFRASWAATGELHGMFCGLRGTQCELASARGHLSVSLI